CSLLSWNYSNARPASLFVPLLVTLLTTTPVEPPYSAPYWCVCTWYSDIESSETRACVPCEPPRRESLSYWPSTRNRLLFVAWPLALNCPPSNEPTCSVGTRPGIVCIRLNWLLFALGELSISEAVMFVPILLAVVSTTGLSPVTMTVSRTPARFIVRLIEISSPTCRTTPVRLVGSKPWSSALTV